MRPELIIAGKDLRLLLRDRSAAFFTFVFPLAVALFFGFIFGGGGETQPLEVAAWSAGNGPAAQAFIKGLEADDSFELKVVPTRADGETLVRRGKAMALVVLPEDFDAKSGHIFGGEGPELEVVVDPSRRAEGGMLTGKLYQVAFQSMFQRFSDPEQMGQMFTQVEESIANAGWPMLDQIAVKTALARVQSMSKADAEKEAASGEAGAKDAEARRNAMANWTPVKIQVNSIEAKPGTVSNAFAISFLQGIAWGLFGAVLSFSSSMADERERGTLLRLLVAPIRPMQVLLGKAGACFVTCLACQWLLLGVGVAFFGVAVSSWVLLAGATVLTGLAFTGIMTMLAGSFRTQSGSQGAGRAVLLVLTMIGGGTVPVSFMPPFLSMASNISPFKWAISACEGATWRGWSLQEMLPSYAVLAVIAAVSMGLGAAAMRRRMA